MKADLITLYSVIVGAADYYTITNFCEDYKVENIVPRKNMLIELSAAYGYFEPIKSDSNVRYVVDEIELEVVDGVDGGKVLMIVGNSPAIEKLVEDTTNLFADDVEVITEEPLIAVPLSYDYNGDHDLSELTYHLRDYLTDDRLLFGEMSTRYLSEDEYLAVLDGDKDVD